MISAERLYFAEIAGVRAAVDPSHTIEVGIVERRDPSTPGAGVRVHWIGPRTWQQIAGELSGHELVTRNCPTLAATLLPIKCERDDSLARAAADTGEQDAISSEEASRILEVLRESGRPDLAAIAEPILERCTRTDRPPPPPAAAAAADPKR